MKTLRAEFEKFHAENPHVYRHFKRFALLALARGRKALSVSLIVERIRWEIEIETASNDGFKINNNHSAYYARQFHKDFPELGKVFKTRKTTASE